MSYGYNEMKRDSTQRVTENYFRIQDKMSIKRVHNKLHKKRPKLQLKHDKQSISML
jgi:hypothetical protein